MRKTFTVILIAVICCFSAFALCGCTPAQYESFEYGNITGAYSRHDAFIGMCFWDGGDKVIELPDEYNGVPVTKLGGATGIGVPNAFYINLRDKDYNYHGNTIKLPDSEYEKIMFTVKIGKNLQRIERVEGKMFFGSVITDENGEEIFDTLYKVVYYFEVDSNNAAYYSKDGRLYRKSNDTVVDEFFYD